LGGKVWRPLFCSKKELDGNSFIFKSQVTWNAVAGDLKSIKTKSSADENTMIRISFQRETWTLMSIRH